MPELPIILLPVDSVPSPTSSGFFNQTKQENDRDLQARRKSLSKPHSRLGPELARHRQGADWRAIHDNSKRAAHRFAAINCSAIPDSLLVSELFGHAKGSLTGVRVVRRGFLEEASGCPFRSSLPSRTAPINARPMRIPMACSVSTCPRKCLGFAPPLEAHAHLLHDPPVVIHSLTVGLETADH
jgi:hypothetical protein